MTTIRSEAGCLPLSAIVLTFNKESTIEACLRSLHGWVGAIIVVDSGSTDGTLDIARRYTDQIFSHPFEHYAAQRNWAQALPAVRHDWVLHVDSDEQVTPELRAALENFFASGMDAGVDGLLIARRTVFLGRWIRHGGLYPVYHLRVLRRGKGRCEDRLYDQHFVTTGVTRQITGDLIDTVTTSLDAWTLGHVRWAGMEAAQVQSPAAPGTGGDSMIVHARLRGTPIEQRRWLRTSVYYRLPPFWRALGYFLYRYFVRLGFLDGTQGLIFHVLQGFWYRFYVDARLWEMHHPEGNTRQ